MITRAIVIGIDGYANWPLSSAVRDAQSFARRLVEVGLARDTEIVMLLNEQAKRKAISSALRELYDTRHRPDRLIFYFSGHGLLAPTDAARSNHRTALVPADVTDVADDAYLLLDFDELCERLRSAGPKQQYFFVDACRDGAFGQEPGNLPRLDWQGSPNPSGPGNAQAVLHAVAPGGTALGVRQSKGVMTGHLLTALAKDGPAADWSDQHQSYVVTMQSIHDHVRTECATTLSHVPQSIRDYAIPELTTTGGPLAPLLDDVDPPLRSLVVTVEPEGSAETTTIFLSRQRNPLAAPQWPPARSGESVPVQPQRYEITAESWSGTTVVEPRWVDCRRDAHATVRVVPFGIMPQPAMPSGDGPGRAIVGDGDVRGTPRRPRDPAGSVRLDLPAHGWDPRTVAEVERLEPPYTPWTDQLESLNPGFHRVRFRIGTEVLSSAEFELPPAGQVTVRPTDPSSPLLRDLRSAHARSGQPGGLVDGMPLGIGTATLLTLTAATGPTADAGRLAVVVAVDGEDRLWRATEVAAAIRCRTVPAGGGAGTAVPLAGSSAVGPGGDGRARVVLGYADPRTAACTIVLDSPHVGQIGIPSGVLPGHRTVVVVTVRPDGSLDLGQQLVPLAAGGLPGEQIALDVREAAIARALYGSDELVTVGARRPGTRLHDLLRETADHPLTACLAYYAWRDAAEAGDPEARIFAHYHATRLRTAFPQLPDTRVIAALESGGRFEAGPAGAGIPLLARSLRELAPHAVARPPLTPRSGWRPAETAPRAVWSATWAPKRR